MILKILKKIFFIILPVLIVSNMLSITNTNLLAVYASNQGIIIDYTDNTIAYDLTTNYTKDYSDKLQIGFVERFIELTGTLTFALPVTYEGVTTQQADDLDGTSELNYISFGNGGIGQIIIPVITIYTKTAPTTLHASFTCYATTIRSIVDSLYFSNNYEMYDMTLLIDTINGTVQDTARYFDSESINIGANTDYTVGSEALNVYTTFSILDYPELNDILGESIGVVTSNYYIEDINLNVYSSILTMFDTAYAEILSNNELQTMPTWKQLVVNMGGAPYRLENSVSNNEPLSYYYDETNYSELALTLSDISYSTYIEEHWRADAIIALHVFYDIIIEAPTLETYIITFETNGGTALEVIEAEAGTTLTLGLTTRTGYTFVTWYTDSALTTEFTSLTMPSADTTLYAKWEAIVEEPEEAIAIIPGYDNLGQDSMTGVITTGVVIAIITAVVGAIFGVALVIDVFAGTTFVGDFFVSVSGTVAEIATNVNEAIDNVVGFNISWLLYIAIGLLIITSLSKAQILKKNRGGRPRN